MVVLPEVTPVTTPVALLTDATAVAAEDHVPPVAVLLRAVVAPTQTVVPPEIEPASGSGLTVTI